MSDDIKATQEIIKKQIDSGKIFVFGIPFSKYQKVYASTNENINGYMSKLNFQDKTSILSVMSSGDHIFNAVYYGITNVDTFDSNKLTEYFSLGIKRSAILAFNYKEYLNFITKIFDQETSLEELTELIKLLFPYMEDNHKIYWNNIIDFNYKLQNKEQNKLNLFNMLLINIKDTLLNINKNSYLRSEQDYNILKSKLINSNISFRCCECLDLPNNFSKQYDFIFLSNIADYFYKNFGYYWKYNKLKEVENNFDNLLKEEGILALAYLFKFDSEKININKKHIISNSNIKIDDLTNEQIITFSSFYENKETKNVKDGLVLSKKYKK